MAEEQLKKRLFAIRSAFSPSAPIDTQALFAGRTAQLGEIMSAMNQRGQHVVLYGERGVGKTSLANVMAEIARALKIHTIHITANRDDNFQTIWQRVFREVNISKIERDLGFLNIEHETWTNLAGLIDDKAKPDDIRFFLQELGQRRLIIVDEFDQAPAGLVSSPMAATIKSLSDHSTDSTLMIVGVADSVDQLMEEHASVERAVVQVRMPRMSEGELAEIIDKGLTRAEMSAQATASGRIVRLSQGLPHYTHLLTLHAATQAALANRGVMTGEDVDSAVSHAVKNVQQSILNTYHKATSSPRRDNLYAEVLLACALSPTDALGYFAPADVREPMSVIMKRRFEIPAFARHLKDLCQDARGPVLQRIGRERRFRYRFINPLMQPFVTMTGISTGKITEELLATKPSASSDVTNRAGAS